MPSYSMESCKSSQQEMTSMTDPPHPGEAEVPGTSVDVASETHVQSSNGQEVVNQAVAAVVASVAHQVQSIFSSTVIRPPSIPGPPILLTSGIESKLKDLWSDQSCIIEVVSEDHWKNPEFPLARIKKIMRMDEDVKMISGEVPVLFSKAIEIFIMELTMRAWLHTEDNKRRTVQRSDIAMAIAKNDMFDFLIDIVPREEIQSKSNKPSASGTSTKDEQGVGNGEMANLLQPDLLQAYVQLLAQQSEGSASTTGGDAETNYCSTSFAQALTANSSLLHQQLVQIQTQQQNTDRLLSQSSDNQFSIDDSQSLLSHSSGSTTVNTLITSASNASQELQPQGREQILAHHSMQPSVLRHSAETSPQRMTPLLSSHNQFTLSTSHQDERTMSGQNVASSEMQQVLIQEIGASVEGEDAETHHLPEAAIHTTSLSSIPSLIPTQSFGSPQIQLDLQSPSMLEFTDDSVVVDNASLTEHVTDNMQHQVSSQ